MSNRKVVRVLPEDSGDWAVKSQGAKRADSIHSNKDDAIERAKEIAKNADLGQVVIYKQDGKIQTEYTYRKDPEKYPG